MRRPYTRAAAAKPAASRAADSHVVVALLLEHAALGDDVCVRLLAASRATAQQVAAALQQRGRRLDVSLAPSSMREARSFAAWLTAHGSLVRSLRFEPALVLSKQQRHARDAAWEEQGSGWDDDDDDFEGSDCLSSDVGDELELEGGGEDEEDEDEPPWLYSLRKPWMSNADAAAAAGLVVAGAMHKAAADGSLASLVSFQSSTSSAVPALLLGLPANLTRLQLAWDSGASGALGYSRRNRYAPLRDGLARLTGLRSLRLTCEDQGESIPTDNSECYKLGKCLSGLTHLQELHIELGHHRAYPMQSLVAHLPTKLSRLTLAGAGDSWFFDLQLTHMTALTSLRMPEWELMDEDALPPNLVWFEACEASQGTGALAALPSLQHLAMPLEAWEMASVLASATRLTHVCCSIDMNAVWLEDEEDIQDLDNLASASVNELLECGAVVVVRRVRVAAGAKPYISALPALKSLPNLTRLVCENVGLSRACVDSLAGVTSMSFAFYDVAAHEKKLARVLARLPELQELQVWAHQDCRPEGVCDYLKELLCAELPHVRVSVSTHW